MGRRLVKKTSICEFPGGLVIKIQWFHCQGQGSIPGQGTEIPKDIRCRGKKTKNQAHRYNNKKEYKTGLELLKQYGAKITCVEIALFEWLKTAKHPNFKEVQALIK